MCRIANELPIPFLFGSGSINYYLNTIISIITLFSMRPYHCTWRHCSRPVFSLTLCRGHFRSFRVQCAWPDCQTSSYCRQVCAKHYRKKEFPPVQLCSQCAQPSYIDNKCFYHYTERQCIQCNRKVFSRQLCQTHYMQAYRKSKRKQNQPVSGSTVTENGTGGNDIVNKKNV